MTNQIHLPISAIQKMASLAVFAESKGYTPALAGVNISVGTDRITAVASDRYVLASFGYSGNLGMAQMSEPDYLSFSQTTCKALLAIKRGRHDLDACLITYGGGVFTVEYQGITYKAEPLADLAPKFEQMISYFDKPLEDSFSGFNLNPSHLAKLVKISKNNWRFDRFTSGTSNQKLAPVLATCDGFNVIIQPTLTK